MVQMLDPLRFDCADTQQTTTESSETGEEQIHEPFVAQLDKEIAVQHWSVEDVANWLQRSVSLQSNRMEECLSAFQNEGIDGLRLLALQRNNHACLGLTDAEWFFLNAARESLLASHDREVPASDSQSSASIFSPPRSPVKEVSGDIVASAHKPFRQPVQISSVLSSSMKLLSFPRHLWSFSTARDEQNESLATEVHALQEEILSAEEREAVLKAKMDYLDEVLRTAQLASYLHTRLRWTPLPGELPVDDVEVDDWLQRFLVLQGSTIFFYPQAADLRPQGAILLSEIVDMGKIPGHVHHDTDDVDWFGFHFTTYEGLRLECATPLKLQMELWLSTVQGEMGQQEAS